MSNDRVGAPGDLQPQVEIDFRLRASLARTMSAPRSLVFLTARHPAG